MFRANALTLYLVFLVFAVGGRIALHYLATGDHGIRTVKPSASRIAKSASFLLLTSFIATIALSILDAIGTVQPQVKIGESANRIGAAISLAGMPYVMPIPDGISWRFGVDQTRNRFVRGALLARTESILSRVPVLLSPAGVLPPHIDAVLSQHDCLRLRNAGATSSKDGTLRGLTRGAAPEK